MKKKKEFVIAILFFFIVPIFVFGQGYKKTITKAPSYSRQATKQTTTKSSIGETLIKPFSYLKNLPAKFRNQKNTQASSGLESKSSRSFFQRPQFFSKREKQQIASAEQNNKKEKKSLWSIFRLGKKTKQDTKKVQLTNQFNKNTNTLQSDESSSNQYSLVENRPAQTTSLAQRRKPMSSLNRRGDESRYRRPAASKRIPLVKSKSQFLIPRTNRKQRLPRHQNKHQWVGAEVIQKQLPVPPAPTPNPFREEDNINEQKWINIPLSNAPVQNNVKYSSQNGKISLTVQDAPISSVLGMIAQDNGLNIVASSEVTGSVTVALADVRLEEALSAILVINGYTWNRNNNIIMISKLSSESITSPLAQGKHVQVFPLNFVSAAEVDIAIKGLLSPLGHSFISETDVNDKLKTREQITIEDLPEYLIRIEQYILQIDQPPRQVYIEAHVLQVTLKDENRHGVNFNQLLRLGNSTLTLSTKGFANPLASPAFFLNLDGTDLQALVELIQSTTDSKTLASPKVFVVNGQEARIQVGEQLGYLVTTTTQTSTLQQVNFLDLGVVLRVTPQITNNNQVLMTVKPEVSRGRINPDTGLPEEDTTEIETTVMLADGQGMIIGGLIKETDIDIQSKIPILGDIWLVGKLFQKQTITRERNEIIIALIPRIVQSVPAYQCDDDTKLQQASTPLFHGPLHRNYRPWEPKLASPIDNPRHCRASQNHRLTSKWSETYPRPLEHHFPTVYERRTELFGGESEIQPLFSSPGFETFESDEYETQEEIYDAE